MVDTKPQEQLLWGVAATVGSGAAQAGAPTAGPPISAQEGAAAVGASVWVTNQRVNALWTIAESRNSWVGIAGVGWRKLANNSDTAVVALTILAANAKQTQGILNYRQEADNMIHEMYLW